ncbi:MAG: flavin reductase, partial [Oscillospiraceae bacterium]
DQIGAPRIAQCPLSLECRVTQVIPLGTHDMFLADSVAIAVDEALIDPSGKLRLDRAGLLAYAHGSYYGLGKHLGDFGFSVRKRPAPSRRSRPNVSGS